MRPCVTPPVTDTLFWTAWGATGFGRCFPLFFACAVFPPATSDPPGFPAGSNSVGSLAHADRETESDNMTTSGKTQHNLRFM